MLWMVSGSGLEGTEKRVGTDRSRDQSLHYHPGSFFFLMVPFCPYQQEHVTPPRVGDWPVPKLGVCVTDGYRCYVLTFYRNIIMPLEHCIFSGTSTTKSIHDLKSLKKINDLK